MDVDSTLMESAHKKYQAKRKRVAKIANKCIYAK